MVFERVLVAYDGSEPADAGLAFALELAGSVGSAVAVLHASAERPGEDRSEGSAARWLHELCSSRGRAAGVELEPVLVEGARPSAAAIEKAEELGADLIVAGRSGRHRIQRFMFGTTAERLIRCAPTATAVFSGRAEVGSPPRVMAAYDGSEPSMHALHVAARLAAALSAGLLVLHVVDFRIPFAESPPLSARDVLREQGQRLLAQATAGLGEPLESVETELREGDPRAEIAQAAADYQPRLLVLANRGAGGFAGLLLGSTAREVAAAEGCPVLIARP